MSVADNSACSLLLSYAPVSNLSNRHQTRAARTITNEASRIIASLNFAPLNKTALDLPQRVLAEALTASEGASDSLQSATSNVQRRGDVSIVKFWTASAHTAVRPSRDYHVQKMLGLERGG